MFESLTDNQTNGDNIYNYLWWWMMYKKGMDEEVKWATKKLKTF